MYRILSASQDTYLTDKYIAGSRSLNSNVGQAATLDLYKLYNETFVSLSASTSGVFERSRLLVEFDLSPLQEMTGSGQLDITDSSFSCYLSLKDVYGGQTTPSNFNIRLIPVSHSWNEGRGSDVIAYRDIDAANYLTASINSGSPSLWFVSGAGASGSLNDPSIDIIVSGNIGSGVQDLTVLQNFPRGDENLLMDVTSLVSASLVGVIPNFGWRLSFSEAEEYDTTTRFVKRFGARHTQDRTLRPRLIVKCNDQVQDSTQNAFFNTTSQDFFTYNRVNGVPANYLSASVGISGSDSLLLRLIASHSLVYITSSWSISHSASINHLTRSLAVLTQSFTGSQFLIGSVPQTGIYSASVDLNTSTNTELREFLSGAVEHKFRYEWVSLDGTLPFTRSAYTTVRFPAGFSSNIQNRNWVANIVNLKQEYGVTEEIRFRVFVQNYDTEVIATRVPEPTRSEILTNLQWRLITAYSRKEVIPFDSVATLCSYDSEGMYFDLWMQDLDVGEVYEIQLKVVENGKDYYIPNNGFRFKVTSG